MADHLSMFSFLERQSFISMYILYTCLYSYQIAKHLDEKSLNFETCETKSNIPQVYTVPKWEFCFIVLFMRLLETIIVRWQLVACYYIY